MALVFFSMAIHIPCPQGIDVSDGLAVPACDGPIHEADTAAGGHYRIPDKLGAVPADSLHVDLVRPLDDAFELVEPLILKTSA